MDVTITADKMGRSVAVIPDDDARSLHVYATEGWTEVADMGHGTSRSFLPGEPAHTLVVEYFAALAKEGVPTEPGPLFTVGTSAWDFDTSWWTQPYSQEAHVPTVWQHPTTGAVRFSG